MKILVTGGNGFVGRHLLKVLKAQCYQVFVISRVGSPNKKNNRVRDVTYLECNYHSLDELVTLFNNIKPEIIINLASGKDRSSLSNVDSSKILEDLSVGMNIIYAAKSLSMLTCFIHIGTSDQYDLGTKCSVHPNKYNVQNSYGFVKATLSLLLDSLFKACNFPYIQIVPSIVYGPDQGDEMFLPALINALMKNEVFNTTGGQQKRDFIYIDDFVSAIVAVIKNFKNCRLGQTYFACYGTTIKLSDLIDIVLELTDKDSNLIRKGAISYRISEQMDYFLDSELLFIDTGWEPLVDLKTGINIILKSNYYNL